MSSRILVGDCRTLLPTLEANSVHAIVCDPPYELGFMGKGWDQSGVAFDPETWTACKRVLMPGGYLLAFGGTRTFHRMTVAIEDAGFEIKDCLSWLYGSGFPKHKSLLKPAWEPIVLAKKRGAGTLNIDACRIEGEPWAPHDATGLASEKFFTRDEAKVIHKEPHALGRWPANVVLDEEAAEILDEQTGVLVSNSGDPFNRSTDKFRNTYSAFEGAPAERGYYGDSGGASRFLYVAKADRAERDKGLAGTVERPVGSLNLRTDAHSLRNGLNARPAHNDHPTVKPISLMSWLVRLVTPPGGTVLDPFMGSGSTGIAADRQGFDFIGIEQNEHYAEIARLRIIGDSPMFAEVSVA